MDSVLAEILVSVIILIGERNFTIYVAQRQMIVRYIEFSSSVILKSVYIFRF